MSSGMTYQAATTRCWTDGESLYATARLGTADHLYGLAAECALKAILEGLRIITSAATAPVKPFKAHGDDIWQQYVLALNGRTQVSLQAPLPGPFGAWRIEDRYAPDAVFTQTRVDGHRNGAKVAIGLLEHARITGIVR